MAEQDPMKDARALLLQFTRSSLKACHVATGELEVAFSRDPDIAISALLQQPAAVGATIGPLDAAPATDEILLGAPHVGTVQWLAAVGAKVAAGEPYARLGLLDETVDVTSAAQGALVRHHVAVGALVEFDQPIASFAN